MASDPLPEPILVLKRSIIRPWDARDKASLAKAANNPNVARPMRNIFPKPYTLADAEFWINYCNSLEDHYNFAVIHPTTGEVMGSIGLVPQKDVHYRTAEFGYWIGEEFWGNGVMSEAVPAFIDWAFANWDGPDGLLRIYAYVVAWNVASRKVLEKAGFAFEGISRASVYKEGKIVDQYMYAAIREDWEKRGAKTESQCLGTRSPLALVS